jgi:hypothetical protein
MEKHKQLREKFGNVLPTDNAVEVLEAVEKWLIERDNQALRIHDVVGRSEQLRPDEEVNRCKRCQCYGCVCDAVDGI